MEARHKNICNPWTLFYLESIACLLIEESEQFITSTKRKITTTIEIVTITTFYTSQFQLYVTIGILYVTTVTVTIATSYISKFQLYVTITTLYVTTATHNCDFLYLTIQLYVTIATLSEL